MDKGVHVQEVLHGEGSETEAARGCTKSSSPVREIILCLHDPRVRTLPAVLWYPTGIVRTDRHCREDTRGHPAWHTSARCFYHTSVTAGQGAKSVNLHDTDALACRPFRDRIKKGCTVSISRRAGVKRTIAVRGSRSRGAGKKGWRYDRKNRKTVVIDAWKYQQQTGRLRHVLMRQRPERPEPWVRTKNWNGGSAISRGIRRRTWRTG